MMSKMSFRAKLGWVVSASLAISIAIVAYRHHGAQASAPLPLLTHIESFDLVDQRGHAVTTHDLEGKIFVADFIFTGCQFACPMLTSKMRSLQQHLEAREKTAGHELPVKLVSFSVDPEVDTPEKLSAYAAKWGADDRRWMFLTGSLAEVNRAVTGGMKIAFQKGGADDATKSPTGGTSAFDVMHGERFVLVDRKSNVRGYFDADPEGMDRLKDGIESLLAE
jgi:protein SCO1/2